MTNPNPNIEGLKKNFGRLARIPKEDMQKIQSKATKAAALKMQERKTFREQIKNALCLPLTNRKTIKLCREAGFEPTQAGNLIRQVVERAGKNAMMFRTLAEILGELQPQQINVNVLANMSDSELQKKIDFITIEQELEEEP
jgi:hypothetical protein